MANSFAMMSIMIGLSLFGRPELAADFGIVHGATVALFYACSGNARSIILARSRVVDTVYILRLRCYLVIPLSALAFILSVGLVSSGWLFAFVLVLRRACEWLAEVVLSEGELNCRTQSALRSVFTQGIASIVVLITLCHDTAIGFWILVVWSVTPLCWCVRRGTFRSVMRSNSDGFKHLNILLPHFGSTAVIGVSVFVFRIFIILLVGSEMAGDLFSAFALGGILGAIFTQALGPTLVHNEFASKSSGQAVRYIALLVWGSLSLGALLIGLALMWPELLKWTGKHDLFWLAVGYSLLGGAIMVMAQRVRLRLIQSDDAQDALGSDILANILLVGCIPFFYYGLGASSLTLLYLLSSTLALVFYASERNGLLSYIILNRGRRWTMSGVALLLFLPIFFQLSGGWYRGQNPYFSSEGNLMQLPLPVSVLAAYVAIALFGTYTRVRLSLIFVFCLFMGMLLSSLLLAGEKGMQAQTKLILIVQYILPVFALVLGQQYAREKRAIPTMAKVWLTILLLVVPAEIISTISEGVGILSPSVYLFSIYQHMQYVPVIFLSGFVIALFSLFQEPRYRKLLILLAPMMGVYLALSFSMLAYLLVFVGVVVFLIRSFLFRKYLWQSAVMASLCGAGIALSLAFLANGVVMQAKFGASIRMDQLNGAAPSTPAAAVGPLIEANPAWDTFEPEKAECHSGNALDAFPQAKEVECLENYPVVEIEAGESVKAEGKSLNNRQERLEYWGFYLAAIFHDFTSFWLGHDHAPDRNKIPSAHNYYLDFAYNFGFLAVTPFFGLVGFTIYCAVRNASRIWASTEILGLTGVVLFLLLADNMLKVGMRQPYPGIVAFFLWGMLISLLIEMRNERRNPDRVFSKATLLS